MCFKKSLGSQLHTLWNKPRRFSCDWEAARPETQIKSFPFHFKKHISCICLWEKQSFTLIKTALFRAAGSLCESVSKTSVHTTIPAHRGSGALELYCHISPHALSPKSKLGNSDCKRAQSLATQLQSVILIQNTRQIFCHYKQLVRFRNAYCSFKQLLIIVHQLPTPTGPVQLTKIHHLRSSISVQKLSHQYLITHAKVTSLIKLTLWSHLTKNAPNLCLNINNSTPVCHLTTFTFNIWVILDRDYVSKQHISQDSSRASFFTQNSSSLPIDLHFPVAESSIYVTHLYSSSPVV